MATTTRRRARFHTLEVAEVRPAHRRRASRSRSPCRRSCTASTTTCPGQYVALRARRRRPRGAPQLLDLPAADPRRRSASAIKRDLGGLFSVWANENLKPGDRDRRDEPARARSPSNLARPRRRAPRRHRRGLGHHADDGARGIRAGRLADRAFTLIYTNRTTQDVMFLEELADLKDRYPARLALHHVLSREQRTAPAAVRPHRRREARRDPRPARAARQPSPSGSSAARSSWSPSAATTLERHGVPSRATSASSCSPPDADGPRVDRGRPVEARAGRRDRTRSSSPSTGCRRRCESPVAANEAILNAALRVRGDVPFACAGGVCGTCRARLVEGDVRDDAELRARTRRARARLRPDLPVPPRRPRRVVVDYDV